MNGWGERNALENPRRLNELDDNPQRSLMGLVFLYIEQTQGAFAVTTVKKNKILVKQKSNVPFKGKYFFPRIQFRLIEALEKQRLISENPSLDFNDVQSMSQVILRNPATLKILVDSLRPDAPVELVLFLKMRL